MNNTSPSEIEKVIQGGYCIGCGGCASSEPAVSMQLDTFGLLQPVGKFENPNAAGQRCPFASTQTEDELANHLFSTHKANHHPATGYFNQVYVGHVTTGPYRQTGSSSGFVSWLLVTLLEQHLIDGVIHVTQDCDQRFAYGVSTTPEQVLSGAKSKYYPVHFDQVIKQVRGDGKRYAFVGLPCFIKSLRLICAQDPRLNAQITCCISLFCGHLKSARYAEFLASQVGVRKAEFKAIDFRVKSNKYPASRYQFSVTARINGLEQNRRAFSSDLYGSDWGLGYFKPKACEWCDDIVGELADISCGDAWLPDYVKDPAGHNILVVRTGWLQELIETAQNEQALSLHTHPPEQVYASQAGNFRHRRDGLGIRVREADQKGLWHPQKRQIHQQKTVSKSRAKLYRQREKLSAKSHHAFAASQGSPFRFAMKMIPGEIYYYWLNRRLTKNSIKLILQLMRLLMRQLKGG